MSYDLLFYPPPGRSLTPDQVLERFARAPHYTIEGEQAWYENEDTGVYFSFIAEEQEEDSEEDEEPEAPFSFNINFFRPHVFVLEAEPEVRAFIEAFDLRVEDPQIEGMGEGRYSAEGLFRGYEHGNRAAYSVMKEQGEDILALPAAQLETAWRWNFVKAELQDALEDEGLDIFVPSINFVTLDTEPSVVRQAVIWTEGVPVILPEVDLVLALLDDPEPYCIELDQLRPQLPEQDLHGGERRVGKGPAFGCKHWQLDASEPLEALRRTLHRGGRQLQLSAVPTERVMTREWL